MKKILAIINPISGTKEKEAIPSLLAQAVEQCEAQLFITYTKYGGHAYELTKQAVEEGYAVVVAVGGDGTVNEVARALVHTQTALAIIPKGSGNGLARSLGIPMNVAEACQVLALGEELLIDSCQANDVPFFCTCGMGFDADVSAAFVNAPFRGFFSYSKIALEKYANYQPERYTVEFDSQDSVEDVEAFVVVAANADQYGNNAYIAPEASMTDGLLDIVIVQPFKRIELPHISRQLFTKKLLENSSSLNYKTKWAKLKREKDGYMHLDGEAMRMPREVEIKLIPQSLKVLVFPKKA